MIHPETWITSSSKPYLLQGFLFFFTIALPTTSHVLIDACLMSLDCRVFTTEANGVFP